MPYKDENVAKLKRKEYYLKNKEHILAKNAAWAKSNAEHVRLKKREYVQSLSEEKKEMYNLKTRERYYQNIERNSVRKKIYKSNNKHLINALSSKRRAAQLHRVPKWLTSFDKLKIKCIYSVASMLTRENKEQWHVDHIIPLQGKDVCGLHVPSNLWFIRGTDNLSKSNKFEGKP
jgi:hypothetical protein